MHRGRQKEGFKSSFLYRLPINAHTQKAASYCSMRIRAFTHRPSVPHETGSPGCFCSSARYASIRALQTIKFLTACKSWSFCVLTASNLQMPSRMRISKLIFSWMSYSWMRKKKHQQNKTNNKRINKNPTDITLNFKELYLLYCWDRKP